MSVLAVVAVVVASWFFRNRSLKNAAKALEPYSLGKICSKEKILELGKRYRELSGENSRDSLMNELLGGFTGVPKEQLAYLALSVEEDFMEDRTVVIDGWLLSITEARQCALLSLEQKTR